MARVKGGLEIDDITSDIISRYQLDEFDKLRIAQKLLAGSKTIQQKLLEAKTLTEAYDALLNEVGHEAWNALESLILAHELKERRSIEREMAPWSQFDIDLLERFLPLCKELPQEADPIKPNTRLLGILESMKEVKLRSQRGY